ncbi:hypothetical protein BU14_0271s0014 [Porphyra umbilicalis]|uniref:Uncharacterized protein n=1 Tax=Porphyra umbilicalis TaxID=2786 RepID=A0A1X6P1H2_PORUM|nr:hypothetical protein BU14_0271s0014 [Porphyra umbilicalis]|eukprot:OSX74718.1 hypothetical protein BU14_0271s0014 [Porphyra umbilicalis]
MACVSVRRGSASVPVPLGRSYRRAAVDAVHTVRPCRDVKHPRLDGRKRTWMIRLNPPRFRSKTIL